ncbi:MAG: SulP family inorganic anion transporter [Acidimicrobiales bacterium]
MVTRWVPGVALLRDYQRRWLSHDLVAGLVLTALLVPQGMAYAELAGLPAVTGLYTTVLALLAYAVFGPSRILVLGPDSALGPLIAAALLPLVGAGGDPTKAVALASALALMMGLVCVLAGVAKIGRVAELLSKPVRVGYLNGIAAVVVVAQLPKLFGFSASGDNLIAQARSFAEGVRDGETVPAALLLGLASLVVIIGLRRWLPKVPGVLVAVVGATVAVEVLDLVNRGVTVVGEVPSGFPTPTLPDVSLSELGTVALAAIGMAFVTLADTSALSRSLAAKRGEDVDPNQEIAALGAANLAAGLFQGFPVSASASRSAVAEDTGSRSQLTGVVGAAAIILILVAFNGIVADLPNTTLAAIVIAAAIGLFDLPTLHWLWRVRRTELMLSMAALLGVALVGVLQGIVIAIVLSLADFVRRAWRPYDAVLGRLPYQRGYHDIDRHEDAEQIPGLILYRFDAPIFFANADWFEESVKAAVAARHEPIAWVIVAAEPITDIDTTGADMLTDLLADLEHEGIDLAFAELKGPVKDRLRRYELYDRVGEDRFFPTLGTAIDGYLRETGVQWEDPAPPL